jgi:hypothetical protein
MEPRNDLDVLAATHGSDKFGSHWYTPHYHRFFSPMRERPIRLLEIGIGGYDDPNAGGASLRMWRDYFPSGEIIGLDWHVKTGIDGDRIRTVQGDQSDPRVIAAIVNSVTDARFDIVIDDGSHRNEHIIKSFLMLFPFVADGGWYVAEDIQTSYWTDHGGSSSDLNAPGSAVAFFKGLIDGVNWREIHRPGYSPTFLDLNILSIHFYHNLVFIEKGPNTELSNFVQANRVPTSI